MKANSFFIVLLFTVFSTVATSSTIDEEESINNLEPFVYEKLKFDKNTDYLHDEKKIEMKNTIPVKQFEILFDGSRKLPEKYDASFLFRETERGVNNTVAARTSELGLFTRIEPHQQIDPQFNPFTEEPKGTMLRSIIYMALILISLIVLFIYFFPRLLVDTSVKGNKKNRK